MESNPRNPVVAVAVARNEGALERWTLALLALEIPHEVVVAPDPPGWVVVVLAEDAARATQTLRAVDDEHEERMAEAAKERAAPVLPLAAYLWSLLLSAGLVLWSTVAGTREASTEWIELGRMSSTAVLEGELHRVLTAITLHADAVHLLGNVVFLLVVAPTVAHRLGPGVAWMTFVLSGAAGNVVTTAVHGPGFSNVGASGGIFGLCAALGILAARTRRSRIGANRWLLGAGAALALLSMLAFGEQADIAAHLGGFGAGALPGLLAPMRGDDSVPRFWRPWQAATFLAAAAALGSSWVAAIAS